MELSTGEEDAQDETIKRYVVLYWILFNDAVSVLFFLYLAFFFHLLFMLQKMKAANIKSVM